MDNDQPDNLSERMAGVTERDIANAVRKSRDGDASGGLRGRPITDDYRVVGAPATFTVLTVVPYVDGPEYREYDVPGDELPMFLERMADDQHAELVVDIEAGAPESEG